MFMLQAIQIDRSAKAVPQTACYAVGRISYGVGLGRISSLARHLSYPLGPIVQLAKAEWSACGIHTT